MQNMTKKEKTTKKEKVKLSYSDIEDIVEYLVKVKAYKYTFDCWDMEDIGQEIRIICLNALPKYDHDRNTGERGILNYFGSCVDNRLKNLKRDKYIRYAPSLSKEEIKKVEECPDKHDKLFEKWKKFQAGLQSKKCIKHPISIDVIGDNLLDYRGFENEIIARDMQAFLIEKIDVTLRPYLLQMIDGRTVNIRIRRRIQECIQFIYDSHDGLGFED